MKRVHGLQPPGHPLPVAGSCTPVLDLGTWRQRSRRSGNSRDIWEEAKDTLCASLFCANVSVIENINKSCYVWTASSKFHFVCVCIPKWELGLNWASFSFSESFGNTPRHSVQISHTWFKSVRLKSVQHRKGNGRTQKFHPAVSTGMEESLNDYKPSPHRTPKPWTSPVLLELKECFCCWNQALLVNSNWGSSTWLNCRLLWKQAWMERININCIFYG